MKKDMQDIADIKIMVDTFYQKVREDDLLKNIFEDIIQDNWDKHLDKMYKFWQTTVLDEQTYFGSPFSPHMEMPINKVHFDRWVEIFIKNIDGQFSGIKVEETKEKAIKIAQIFSSKLEYYNDNKNKPIV